MGKNARGEEEEEDQEELELELQDQDQDQEQEELSEEEEHLLRFLENLTESEDKIGLVVEFVEQTSVDTLRSLGRDFIMAMSFICEGNPIVVQTFLFAKNIKIYGGINEYIDSFLSQLDRTLAAPNSIAGALFILTKMIGYQGISNENTSRVSAALARIEQIINSQSGKKHSKKEKKKYRNKSKKPKKSKKSKKHVI